jgi:hypothetical protein
VGVVKRGTRISFLDLNIAFIYNEGVRGIVQSTDDLMRVERVKQGDKGYGRTRGRTDWEL